MDVGAAPVAGAEPFEGMPPGEAALDHPALTAQSIAGLDTVAGDPRGEAPGAQLATVLVVVVARGRRRGRPRWPRIGGTASTRGMS